MTSRVNHTHGILGRIAKSLSRFENDRNQRQLDRHDQHGNWQETGAVNVQMGGLLKN